MTLTDKLVFSEGIPITSPDYWTDEVNCSDETLRHIFRSATSEPMPMLDERISYLREAGRILQEQFEGTFMTCLEDANHSATTLVDLLVTYFDCFRDESRFEDEKVRFYKRAQILAADLWACFEGEGYGRFDDIDKITMFAGKFSKTHSIMLLTCVDYRIPQMLCSLGCMQYSPPLDSRIRQLKPIESGHPWEVQLRGKPLLT